MNLIAWEKNPNYPMNFATCRTCGSEGLMKQAWDLHGYLCVDAKTCLNRVSKTYTNTNFMIQNQSTEDFEVSQDLLDHDGAQDAELGKDAMAQQIQRPASTIEEILDNPSIDIATKLQWFTCEKCNEPWSRPSTRGRPPKVCPDCR